VIRRFDDAAQVARAAAELFCDASAEARDRFRVALAGGSSPRAVYALLAAPPFRERVDWARVEVYFGDERCVPPDHPDSNFKMANDTLLSKVPIPPAQIHRIAGEKPPGEAAAEYAALVRGVRLDLVYLGMGPDGHTASLFPGTTALAERDAAVAAVFVPKLDTWRVTMTAPYLSSAARVMIGAAGAEKADALHAALETPPGAVPIQLIQPRELIWLVDAAAAAKLSAAT
jgi:6-phosphogluconolactonase